MQGKTICWKFLRAVLVALSLFFFHSQAQAANRQQLHGHVPAAVAKSSLGARLVATEHLWLAIALPWRNQGEIANLIKDLYDKSSPQYKHYLTPEQFTEKFGPTPQDYQALQDFLKSKGLLIKGTSSNRLIVDADGAVGDIEKAFNVELHIYTRPDGTTFYAPDREPSLDLSTPIDYIHGLDNANPPHPLYKVRPAGAKKVQADQNTGSGTGGCSGCYVGSDFRNAYATGVTLTGTGVTSAVLCIDGILQSDITTYEQMFNLPNVPISIVAVDGFNPATILNPPNGENSLDIEQQISMAPGLQTLMLYMGSQNIDDDLNAYATQNVAKTISISYGWGPDTTITSIAQQCAAQGQSVFIASGDSGAFIGGIGGDSAEESPYLTVVGGTDLTTNGAGGSWQSESAWVDGGGGICNDVTIPSYQTGINMSTNYGSTTQRNLPDVSMFANFGFLIIASGEEINDVGGTSGSTPLWAAFTALANEQAIDQGKPTVGFVNPTASTIGLGSSYTSTFHDITTGNNGSVTEYPAVPGYDLATGWGSPNGQNMINALSNVTGAPTATPTKTFTPVTSSTWRVRGGASTSYTDCQSNVWAPDENYNTGSPNSSTSSISKALPCSTDQALYQTEHWAAGSFTYTFNVPAGSYQVTLKFAELFDAAGQRIMDVTINGTQVLTNFDINATAGGLDIALDEVFNNISPSSGKIVITFATTSSSPDQNAKVDALQVIPQPSSATNTPTFTPTKTFTPTNTPVGVSSPTSTPCTPTAITPYIQVNGGSWQETNSATVTLGSTVNLGPQPLTGTWSWTGPNGFTSSSREIDGIPLSAGTDIFVATYTNSSGCKSTETFTITVTSSSTPTPTPTACTPTAITPYIQVNGGSWQETNSATVTLGSTVNLGPQPLTGTWSWTGPNGFTSSSREIDGIPLSAGTDTFVATYTNSSGCQSKETFTITVTSAATPTFTNTPAPPTATFTFTPTFTPTTSSGGGNCAGVAAWNGNFVAYSVGALVTYDGVLYQCIQAHTSEPTWEPPATPALWEDLGACTSTAIAAKNVDELPTPTPSLEGIGLLPSVVAAPNVSRNGASIQFRYQLPQASSVRLSLFNLTGERVYQASAVGQAGGNSLTWAPKNNTGAPVATGLYIYTLQVFNGNVPIVLKGKVAVFQP